MSPGELRRLAERAEALATELRDIAVELDRERAAPVAPPPVRAAQTPPGRIWFNTKQVAERLGIHPTTVLKACEAGELHGVQRKPGGRWRIHVDCLDAWIGGRSCPHR